MSLFRHFIRYVTVLSCGVILVLAPHMAGQALAQPGEAHEQVGKTQRRVLDRAREGVHQEVIVVFDPTSTEQSIDALPVSKKRSRTDINSAQAAHYEAQRQLVFQGFRADEAQELESHKHLPTSRVRIKSEAALQKILQQPDVIGVNAEEEVWPMLAQSLPLVHQPDVSSQGYQGKGTAVAVIDTGIDYTKSAFNRDWSSVRTSQYQSLCIVYMSGVSSVLNAGWTWAPSKSGPAFDTMIFPYAGMLESYVSRKSSTTIRGIRASTSLELLT